MKKSTTYLLTILLVVLPILSSSASAADREKDEDRLTNSGVVLKEVLDVPDDMQERGALSFLDSEPRWNFRINDADRDRRWARHRWSFGKTMGYVNRKFQSARSG
jgi:hypothetical protein